MSANSILPQPGDDSNAGPALADAFAAAFNIPTKQPNIIERLRTLRRIYGNDPGLWPTPAIDELAELLNRLVEGGVR